MTETVKSKAATENTVARNTVTEEAADPTAPADTRTMLGTHPRPVFICSPYRPTIKDESCRESELEANIDRAKRACRIAVALGFLPLAPHLYFTRFLNDEEEQERETGMRLGMQWLEESDEVWVFGDRVSAGMKAEIKRAKELGKNVRRLPEPGRVVELLLRELERQAAESSTADNGTVDNDTVQPEAAESEE